MKGRNLMLTAIISLCVGVALIVFHRAITARSIVVTGGILFILAGVINVLLLRSTESTTRSKLSMTASWITSAAGVILGLSMLLFQGTFASLVSFMFGVLVMLSGLYLVYMMAVVARPVKMPLWLYAAPALMIAAAIYLLFQNDDIVDVLADSRTIMVVTGIGVALFGLGLMAESIVIKRAVDPGDHSHEPATELADMHHTIESGK